MTNEIACGNGQGGVGRTLDLVIAPATGLMFDLGVDVARGAGHVARAHRLAAGGFHRLIEVTRHALLRGIAGVHAVVVVLETQRQRIGSATGQQDLVAGHAARDLRQTHLIAGDTRRINGVGHRQIGFVGHDLGGLGQRLLERVGGVVVRFFHRVFVTSSKLIRPVARSDRTATCTSSASITLYPGS